MPGMLNEALARQRLQELLRRAEQERRGAPPGGDRARARGLLERLLGRRQRDLESGGKATIVECPDEC